MKQVLSPIILSASTLWEPSKNRNKLKPSEAVMKLLKHRKKVDLEAGYTIRLEIGLIVALLILIGMFNMRFEPETDNLAFQTDEQETVKMEEIEQTEQVERPPAPPRPPVPVEVPNDEIITDEIIDLDAELDLENMQMMDMPEPPAPPEDDEDGEDEVFVVVETMPQLKGGISSVMKHINYPEIAQKAGIEGRVYVQFIIDEQGNVNNPVVLKGIGGGCDEEAIRAVKKAQFTPGLQRGKPVKVKYSMPILFRLNEASNSR